MERWPQVKSRGAPYGTVVSVRAAWCYSRRALAALLSLLVFVGTVGLSYQGFTPEASDPVNEPAHHSFLQRGGAGVAAARAPALPVTEKALQCQTELEAACGAIRPAGHQACMRCILAAMKGVASLQVGPELP
jgi:hypothetical protein